MTSEGLRIVAIVQARYGSSRLPGKVLKPLAHIPVLQHVLSRCQKIPSVDDVVCATTKGEQEDEIVRLAEAAGVGVFRGSEVDVLGRYHDAAVAAGADIILRVTSDCPLIDPDICEAVVQLRQSEGADYAANNLSKEWPHGLDCEAFTFAVLREANRHATNAYDREHVTPWMRRASYLDRVNLPCTAGARPELRWTLDYPEDLAFFEKLFEEFSSWDPIPDSKELIRFLDLRPDISAINQHLSDR